MGIFEKEFRGLTPADVNWFANTWLNPSNPETYYIRKAQLAQSAAPERASRDPYFDIMGQNFIEIGTATEKTLNPNGLSIGRIAEIFQMGFPNYCEEAAKKIKDPQMQQVLKTVVDGKDVKSIAEVIQNVRSHLSAFLMPPIADAFSHADVWPGDCRRRRQTIIFINPMESMGAMNIPTRFFIEGVLQQLVSPQFAGAVPVMIQIDELAQYGKIESVAKGMSSLRKFGS